jgi:hypothetical protein
MTIYTSAKAILRETAQRAKANHPNDKPAIRQIINDMADQLERELERGGLLFAESGKEINRYKKQLQNLACKLHPKD